MAIMVEPEAMAEPEASARFIQIRSIPLVAANA